MLSPERKRTLMQFSAFLIPIILVKGSGVILGGGPAGAAASTVEPAELTPSGHNGKSMQWTEANLAAAAHCQLLEGEAFGESPLFYPSGIVRTQPVVSDPAAERPADLQVTVMMKTVDGAVALINGQPYRVGQLVEAGPWQVTAIEPGDRYVDFVHTQDGTTRREQIER